MKPAFMAAVPVLLLFGSATLSLVQYSVRAQDPCTSYSVLTDASRSVLKENLYSIGSSDNMNGWYRFMSGAGDSILDYIPKTRIGYYRCSAKMPGYLSGQHPRGSEGIVTRSVCFVHNGNTCFRSTSIQVKNCGNYYVYRLYALRNDFIMRYCGSGEVGK